MSSSRDGGLDCRDDREARRDDGQTMLIFTFRAKRMVQRDVFFPKFFHVVAAIVDTRYVSAAVRV